MNNERVGTSVIPETISCQFLYHVSTMFRYKREERYVYIYLNFVQSNPISASTRNSAEIASDIDDFIL